MDYLGIPKRQQGREGDRARQTDSSSFVSKMRRGLRLGYSYNIGKWSQSLDQAEAQTCQLGPPLLFALSMTAGARTKQSCSNQKKEPLQGETGLQGGEAGMLLVTQPRILQTARTALPRNSRDCRLIPCAVGRPPWPDRGLCLFLPAEQEDRWTER